jgi:hypothetical protein
MFLSLEEKFVAEQMHQFVQGYKRQMRWMIFASLNPLLLLLQAYGMIANGALVKGCLVLGAAVAFEAASGCLTWELMTRYRRESAMLRLLEREHHDELPWVRRANKEAEMENSSAATRDLEQGLANGHVTS